MGSTKPTDMTSILRVFLCFPWEKLGSGGAEFSLFVGSVLILFFFLLFGQRHLREAALYNVGGYDVRQAVHPKTTAYSLPTLFALPNLFLLAYPSLPHRRWVRFRRVSGPPLSPPSRHPAIIRPPTSSSPLCPLPVWLSGTSSGILTPTISKLANPGSWGLWLWSRYRLIGMPWMIWYIWNKWVIAEIKWQPVRLRIYRNVSPKYQTTLMLPSRWLFFIQCKNVPPPGAGVEVLNRFVRICLFDGKQFFSNGHTVQADLSKVTG